MPRATIAPKLVQRATHRPGKCAVTADIDGPFIDCGIEYENRNYWTRLYLHAPWVEQVARDCLNMVPRSEIAALEARVKEAEAKLDDQEKIVSLLDKREEIERELEEVIA